MIKDIIYRIAHVSVIPISYKGDIKDLLRKQRRKEFLTPYEKDLIKAYAEERRIKNQTKKQSHGKTVHQNRK